jgi:predicted metal-dependent hydrolase
LRVRPDGCLRLTVPRGGSIAAGLRFAAGERAWIEREWHRVQAGLADWADGSVVWFRGEQPGLVIEAGGVRLGALVVPAPRQGEGVRSTVEGFLRALAREELTARATHLAAVHGRPCRRVTVRNQRSRWGSCSPRGAVALNWRLIQMPPAVADYVILHELAHLGHPNHSAAFWREVAAICPGWRDAERWLRTHGRELF